MCAHTHVCACVCMCVPGVCALTCTCTEGLSGHHLLKCLLCWQQALSFPTLDLEV